MAGKEKIKAKREVKKAIAEDQKRLKRKRFVTGDGRWMPAKGAGVMPENVWKKYQPESKKLQDYVEPGESDDV